MAQVNDINVWLQCFISYVRSCRGAFRRRSWSSWLIWHTYVRQVRSLWAHYDATFRKQAASSGNRRWSCLNASLYLMCFTGRAASGKYCELCFSAAHVTRELVQPGSGQCGRGLRMANGKVSCGLPCRSRGHLVAVRCFLTVKIPSLLLKSVVATMWESAVLSGVLGAISVPLEMVYIQRSPARAPTGCTLI